jgi:uncharacterized protein (DUF1800 family)
MGTKPALVAHLYRRAGFGTSAATVARESKRSWDDIVDDLLAGLHDRDAAGDRVPLPKLTSIPQANVPGYEYNGYEEFANLITWWVERMVVTDTPLREKLVLLLHDQFPTSWFKVGWASLMYTQNQIFRTSGPGNFHALTLALAMDPAMLIWLDTTTSHKEDPNQNFARELMERFTMGAGHYSQEDVIQGARCFTGWELDYTTGKFYLNPYDHDNGSKTYLGHKGNLTGADVIEIATATSASHTWVVSRLWSWLAYPVTQTSSIVAELAKGYAKDLDITNLLSAILRHPAFQSNTSINGLIKQPIEYVVGALRTLGLRTTALPAQSLAWYLLQLGQQPFAPPSVGGWGENQFWLTTSASAMYIEFASGLAGIADLTDIENHNGNPKAQVQAVTDLLNVEAWSKQTAGALSKLADQLKDDGGSWPAQQLVTLALVSPEFMMN